MKKLLCLLLALAAVCLAACGEAEPTAEPTTEAVAPTAKELIRYECDGLAVYLGEEFQKQDMMFSAGCFTSTTGDTLQIWTEELRDYDGAVTSSQSYAQTHVSNIQSQYQSIEIKEQNGISYSVATNGNGYQVCGYYTGSTDCWIIQLWCTEVTDDILRYATSAEVML